MAMARQVDSVSSTLYQTTRVQSTLDSLTTDVENGVVRENVATEAVRRIKLAQNVTETTVVGAGPAGAISPENPGTLVGLENGTGSYDIAGRAIGGAIAAGVEAALTSFAIGKIVDALPSFVIRGLDKAKDAVSRVQRFVADVIYGTAGSIKGVTREQIETFVEGLKTAISGQGVTSGTTLARRLANDIAGVSDSLARTLLSHYESGSILDMDKTLLQMDSALGTPTLKGSFAGAKSAMNSGIDTVNATYEGASEGFDKLETVLSRVGFLGAFAAVFTAVSGGTLGAVAAFVELAAVAAVIGAGIGGALGGSIRLMEATVEHNTAVANVVNGGA
jgi:hypothetical protein